MAGSPRGQTTELENVTEQGSVIAIKHTPGLSRAYHDLVITPKRASALTIPVDGIAYNKRVKDLRNDGHDIFRPRGTNLLAEKRGEGKEARLRPLYVLVRKAVVPKDEGLLPTDKELREWTTDAAEEFFTLGDMLED